VVGKLAPHFFGALILSIGDPFASVAAERNFGDVNISPEDARARAPEG
jgi:hypothetical protein